MKKFTSMLMAVVICACGIIFTGCGANDEDEARNKAKKTLTVGATSTPHAEILEEAKKILEEDGYTLHIAIYNDYERPNETLSGGALEANYFQHKLYLDDYNEKNKTSLISAAEIHYEPLGIYGNGVGELKELKKGATIIIPEDESNQTRALFLLAQAGIITLPQEASIEKGVTTLDITDKENINKYNITPVHADSITEQLKNSVAGTIAVINGNYAMEEGFKIKDALALESEDSDAAKTYANIVAIRKENKDNEIIEALVKALKSDRIKKFIEEKYKGAVVPLF